MQDSATRYILSSVQYACTLLLVRLFRRSRAVRVYCYWFEYHCSQDRHVKTARGHELSATQPRGDGLSGHLQLHKTGLH